MEKVLFTDKGKLCFCIFFFKVERKEGKQHLLSNFGKIHQFPFGPT